MFNMAMNAVLHPICTLKGGRLVAKALRGWVSGKLTFKEYNNILREVTRNLSQPPM